MRSMLTNFCTICVYYNRRRRRRQDNSGLLPIARTHTYTHQQKRATRRCGRAVLLINFVRSFSKFKPKKRVKRFRNRMRLRKIEGERRVVYEMKIKIFLKNKTILTDASSEARKRREET